MLPTITFIINPISGGKNKQKIPAIIQEIFPENNYSSSIFFTEHENHATEITQQELKNGVSTIVAIGGDGTINEVAKVLINTNTNLGIVPMGSGNGLARHLGIPLSPTKALTLIKEAQPKTIDTCSVNSHPFLCTSGIGFDAKVAHAFATLPNRGLVNYIKSGFNHFLTYKPKEYTLSLNGETIKKTATIITIANANQYGNNTYIAPNAKIDDGLMNVCIVKPHPKLSSLVLALKLFLGTVEKYKYYEQVLCSELTITNQEKEYFHFDGEPGGNDEQLTYKIIPKSLTILCS